MAEFREYLVMLNSDPGDTQALAELQKLPPAVLGSPEAASALDEARVSLRVKGAAETAVHLYDVELAHVGGERQAKLLLGKAQVVFEDLLNAGSGVACLDEALRLQPGLLEAQDLLKHLELVKTHWEEIVEKYLAEAEATTEKTLATTLYRAAAETYARYRPEAAECEEYLRKALEVDPTNQRAATQLSRLLHRSERWDELRSHLESTIESVEKVEVRNAAWVQLADLAKGPLQDPPLALKAMKMVIAADPAHPRAIALLSQVYENEQNWAAAVTLYANALKSRRRSGSPETEIDMLIQIGMLHWKRLDDADAAEEYFARLRKLSPAHPIQLDFYKSYYVATEQAGKLMQLYRQALKSVGKSDPERKQVLMVELAQLSEGSMDNPEKAIDSWKSILRADPGNTEATESLRRLYERTGKWNPLLDLIKDDVEKLAADDVQGRVAGLMEVVEIYRDHLELNAMVINTYNSILTIDPSNLMVLDELAAKYRELGRWNDLIAVLGRKTRVESVESDLRASLLSEIASLWIDRFGNYAQAIKPLEELFEMDPNNAEAITRLKEIYTRRRQWRALIALLGREAESLAEPERRVHYADMARLAGEKLGDSRLSINIWNRVLELPGSTTDPDNISPDTPAVYDALCTLYEREKRYPALAEMLFRRRAIAVTPAAALPLLETLGSLFADRMDAPAEAAKVYREILELNPEHGKAARVLRELYAASRDYDALESLYGGLGQWDELIESYFIISDKFQDRTDTIHLLERAGRVASESIKNPDKVARVYERLQSVDPKHLGAAQALAPIYRQAGKWARLLSIHEILLEHADETTRSGLLNDIRELCEAQLGSKSLAFQWTVKAYELNPNDKELLKEVQRLGAESEAWLDLSSILNARVLADGALEEEKLELLRELGRIAEDQLHEPDQARAYYRRVLELRPSDKLAMDALEELAADHNEWPVLLEILRKRVGLESDAEAKVELLFKIARIEEEQQEELAAAVSTYEKVMEMDGENRRAMRALARIHSGLGDWQSLASILEREVVLEDDSDAEATLHFRLGELYQSSLSRPADARESFKRSLVLAPSQQVYDALEAFLSPDFDEDVRVEMAELLLPAFEQGANHQKMAEVMEILLSAADDDTATGLQRRLASLYDGELNDPQSAYRASLNLLRLQPDDADNRRRLDMLGRQLDSVAEMRDALRDSLAICDAKGCDPIVKLQIAQDVALLSEDVLADAAGAKEAWLLVLSLDESHPDAFRSLSQLLRLDADWIELKSLLEKHAQRAFDTEEKVRSFWELAELYEGPLEDPAGAEAAYVGILEADPEQSRAYDCLMRTFERSERWRELEALLGRRADYLDGEELEQNDTRRARLRLDELGEPKLALDLAEELIGRRTGNAEAREICEELLAKSEFRLRVARVLEPIYASEGLWKDLCGVLVAQSEFCEVPHEAFELLMRVAAIEEGELGHARAAAETWMKALKIDPVDERALPALLRLMPEVDAWPELADTLMTAVDSVDSTDLVTQSRLLRAAAEIVQERLADSERAVVILQRLLDLESSDPEMIRFASSGLDVLYAASSEFAKQVAVLRRAAEWAESSDEKRNVLTRIAEIEELALEDQAAALKTWELVLAEDGEDLVALSANERLLEAAGEYGQMADISRRRVDLIQDIGERAEGLRSLSKLYHSKLDNSDEAINCLLEVVDLEVDTAPVLVELSKLYRADSRFDELLETLEQRISAAEGSERAELLFDAGVLLADELSRGGEATEHFADVLRIESEHAGARERLALLLSDSELRHRAAEILDPLYEAGEAYEELIQLLTGLTVDNSDQRQVLVHLRRIAKLEEGRLQDTQRAFTTMTKAAKASLAEPELPEVLSELQRLAAENGALDVLVGVYRDIAPDVFDGDLQRRLYLDIADLSRAVLQDDATAREYYRLVVDAQPDDQRALTALEGICRAQEDYPALYDILVQKADLAGDELEKRANAIAEAGSICAEHLDRLDDAAMHWEQVLELTPDAREIADKLQSLYRKAERWHDLAEALENRLGFAMSVQEAVDTRFRLGQLHEDRMNDAEAAVENYGAALGGDPGHAAAKAALLRLLDEPGTRIAAAEILEPIHVAQQDWPQLVRIYEIKLEAAEDPASRLKLTKYIARLHEDQLEDLEGAFHWLGRVFRESPGDHSVRMQLERLANVLQSWQGLAEIYQKYLDDEQSESDELRVVAETLAEIYNKRLNQVDRALAAYQRVLEIQPDDLQVFARTETMLIRAEQWADLVSIYEGVLHASMDDARRQVMYAKLAQVQEHHLDDKGKAVDALRSLLEINPDNEQGMGELDRLLELQENWYDLADLLQSQIDRGQSDDKVLEARLRLAQLREGHLDDLGGAIDEYEVVLTMPNGELAVSALERLIVNESCQGRIADILEPVYRSRDHWQKLVVILDAQLRHTDDSVRRSSILREIAEIHEQRGGDLNMALDALGKAWLEEINDSELYDHFVALGYRLSNWSALTKALEAGLKDQYDYDLVGKVLLQMAQIQEQGLQDIPAAVKSLVRLLQVTDDHPQALVEIDRLYTQQNSWDELVKIVERRAELANDPDEALQLLRRVALTHEVERGDRAAAIQAYRNVLSAESNDANALDALERLLTADENWSDLAQVLLSKVDVASDAIVRRMLHFQLADIYQEQLKDSYEAISQTRAVLELDPNDLEALGRLRLLLEAEAMWPDMVEVIDQQAAICEGQEKVDHLYAAATIVEKEMSDKEAAVERYATILELSPAHAGSRAALELNKANDDLTTRCCDVLESVYRAENNYDALVPIYERRIEAADGDLPTRGALFGTLAEIHEMNRDDVPAAFETWARAVKDNTEDEVLQGQLERLAGTQGNWDALVSLYESILGDTSDGQLEYLFASKLGGIYEESLGNLDLAAERYEQAHGVAEVVEPALTALIRIYEHNQKFTELAETYRRLAEATMDEEQQATLLFNLGDVREHRLGLAADAVSAYRDVLERDPSHSAARGALERLLVSSEEQRADIVAILEPLYEEDGDSALLADLLSAKVGIVGDAYERAQVYARLAELAEKELGDLVRALDAVGGWLAEEPGSDEALAELLRLGESADRVAEVTARLDGIVAASDSEDVQVRLAQASATLKLEKLGDMESAAVSFESLLVINPDDEVALSGMESVCRQRGDIARLALIQWHRAELTFDTGDKRRLMAETAQLRLQLGLPEEAIAAWKAVLDLDEADAEAHEQLAAQYRVAQSWPELIEILGVAARYAPDVDAEVALRTEIAQVYAQAIGDLDQGVHAWQAVLDLRPSDLAPLDALESLHRQREDFHAVQDILLRRVDLVDTDSEKIAAYLRLSQVAEMDREAPEEALDFLRSVVEIDRSHAQAKAQQERLLRSLERWHDLVEFYQRSAEHCADVGDVAGELQSLAQSADIWEGPIDNPDEAAAILEKILERDPNSVAAMTRLAKIYEAASDWERCEATLEKALALGPQGRDAADLYVRLGEVARNKDSDEAKAQQYFGQALHADGYHLAALQHIEDASREKEDWILVADMVRRRYQICQDAKERLDLTVELADLYGTKLGQPEQVIPILEAARTEAPEDARILGPLADLYFHAGRHDEAAPMFEKLAEEAKSKRRMKDVASYKQRLGGILEAKGLAAEATTAYEEAFRVDPTNVRTMAGLGKLYMDAQNWDKARRVYRSMVLQNIDPSLGVSKADVYFHLGQIHAALEETPKAKDMFKRALSTDKNHAQARAALDAFA
jgi:tetratricopeptide (TPR) repeat protein